MELSHSEMFLAEPKPQLRLSRQHLCCLSERSFDRASKMKEKSEPPETAQPENGQRSCAVPSALYIPSTRRRIVRDSVYGSHLWNEPLHFTTVKIGKVGKIFVIFLLQKDKIGISYKNAYLLSCMMMYSFSFSLASLRRYLTLSFVVLYLLARYINVTLPVP